MRPVAKEFRVLLGGDPAVGQAPVGAVLGDRPAFAGGERLAKEREIGERRHDFDARLGLEILPQGIEVELRFEMVHARLEDRLAVQADPEPDGVGPGEVGQGRMGEVVSRPRRGRGRGRRR